MTDKLNETIKEIAIKHGVILGKDDPILILQTMNERLIEENRKTQQDMLLRFKEEMENISSQWKDDAQKKAEKIINTALAGSKEVMTRLLRESTNESIQAIKKMISDSLVESHGMTQQNWKFNWFKWISSLVILTGLCVLIALCLFPQKLI